MTLHEFFDPRLDMLVHRVSGPMSFRFILQPIVAAVLAIRTGIHHAHTDRSPAFFVPALFDASRRRDTFRLLWADVSKVFIVAYVVDIVYDWKVNHSIYPVNSLIVAIGLAIVPYLLMRGPAALIARTLQRK